MKAIVINGCCKAEDLHVSNIPVPQVRPGWVLVRIHAAGLNHSEALLRLFEADQSYINTPIVPGIECTGEIVALPDPHPDFTDPPFSVGDRVIALMGGMGRSFNGSYAEYALLPVRNVFRVDTDLDWLSLAAIPETYYTAYGSLTDGLQLTETDTLLIRGATSTVGQAAIQLAKAIGATVIAACRREESFSLLHGIGADHCVTDDGQLSRKAFPVTPNKLLELVGPKTLPDSLLTVSRPGYVCDTGILGNEFTVKRFDPIKYIPNGVFLSGFYSNDPTQEAISRLFTLIRRHHIKPLYTQVFTLEEIVRAHAILEQGKARGKIILQL